MCAKHSLCYKNIDKTHQSHHIQNTPFAAAVFERNRMEDSNTNKGHLRAIICPSLLSADFATLAHDANRILELGADYLHIDVMDGHFVDNLTIGPPVVKSLRKHTKGFMDCHLMVSEPEKWVSQFAEAGADNITFHFEASRDPKALIEKVHDELNKNVGISVKPGTRLEDSLLPLFDKHPELVDKLHMVLIMTVEPGFGGQKFMVDQMDKVRTLRQKYPCLNIEVDGGLTEETVVTAAEAGANVIVAGSAIFKSDDPKRTMEVMRNAVQKNM